MDYNIKIAIISDLHCHPTNVNYKSETFLKSDLLRNNTFNHPVEALNDLIETNHINVDIVLCPGDFSNKADVQGFISGWDFVLEIAKKLKSENIIATIGNHDVPSRDAENLDILSIAKGIGKDFPIKNRTLLAEFWDNGFCLIEDDNFQILVINSVKFHSNQSEIDRGRLSDQQLNNIKEKLQGNSTDKIKIALCHHHPIPHERLNLGSQDLMILGSELVDLLNSHKFDLLVHGHKHDPWLRYSTGSNSLPVFSAGSFSATEQIIFSDRRNTFHTVEISKKNGSKAQGIIETYEFYVGKGWEKSSGKQSLPFITGFGSNVKTEVISNGIETLMSSQNYLKWEDIKKQVSDLIYLTHQELVELEEQLLSKNIQVVPSFPSSPQYLIKL
ncbi:cyclic 3',5'-adenosine monophosphate phosphodiesterase [compost metagenome]